MFPLINAAVARRSLIDAKYALWFGLISPAEHAVVEIRANAIIYAEQARLAAMRFELHRERLP